MSIAGVLVGDALVRAAGVEGLVERNLTTGATGQASIRDGWKGLFTSHPSFK